jgi:hypothetical protein
MLVRATLALIALAPLAAAETLRVPKDFDTIQEAVDAAQAGDTILIAKGQHAAPVLIEGRSDLELRGAGHPVLDASAVDTGLSITGSSGIRITGLDVAGAGLAGILVSDSTDVLVQRCRITGSGSEAPWPQAAIQVAGGSQVRLERNRAEQVVVGLRFYGEGGPEATGCTLFRNVVDEVWHAAVELRGSGHVVERNLLRHADVGLFLEASATTVLRNTIRDVDTGIDVFGGEDAQLERNLVRKAGLQGVHVAAAATGTTLLHDTIAASGSAAALVIEASGASAVETRILKATGDGVHVSGAGCTLADLRVIKPAVIGLRLDGESHTVTGLLVSGAGQDGVAIPGHGNVLTDCKASKTTALGFTITGNENTLDACTSLDAGVYDLAKGGLNNTYTLSCKFKDIWGG